VGRQRSSDTGGDDDTVAPTRFSKKLEHPRTIIISNFISGTNLATLVEYGTTDPRAIELQEIGFSRNTASKLLIEQAASLYLSTQGELENIDTAAILASENGSATATIAVGNIVVKTNHKTSSTIGRDPRQEPYPYHTAGLTDRSNG
jgi:hypothetical protein